jgi:hypothetical protein
MPYRKVGPDDYVSPTGKHINGKQNKLWHTLGGRWPGESKSEEKMSYSKGMKPVAANYASGGPVLGRTRDFIKEPDNFREDGQKKDYSGKGSPAKRSGDKSLKAVKPKK